MTEKGDPEVMNKNPTHFYWGRKNGLVVTREGENGSHPEVVFVSNQLSLEKLQKAAAVAVVGLLFIWRVARRIHRHQKKRK